MDRKVGNLEVPALEFLTQDAKRHQDKEHSVDCELYCLESNIRTRFLHGNATMPCSGSTQIRNEGMRIPGVHHAIGPLEVQRVRESVRVHEV